MKPGPRKFREFEIDGTKYRTDKINVIDQAKLVQTIAPLMPVLANVRDYFMSSTEAKVISLMTIDAKLLGIIGNGIAELPEASLDKAMETILSVVQRDETGKGNWLPVWDDRNATLLHAEMDLRELLLIAQEVFNYNLASFTSALGLRISGTAQAA